MERETGDRFSHNKLVTKLFSLSQGILQENLTGGASQWRRRFVFKELWSEYSVSACDHVVSVEGDKFRLILVQKLYEKNYSYIIPEFLRFCLCCSRSAEQSWIVRHRAYLAHLADFAPSTAALRPSTVVPLSNISIHSKSVHITILSDIIPLSDSIRTRE